MLGPKVHRSTQCIVSALSSLVNIVSNMVVNANISRAAFEREATKRLNKRARKEHAAANFADAAIPVGQGIAGVAGVAYSAGVLAEALPVTAALAVGQGSRVAKTAAVGHGGGEDSREDSREALPVTAVADSADAAIAVGQGMAGVAEPVTAEAEVITSVTALALTAWRLAEPATPPSTFAEALVTCLDKAPGTLTDLEKSALKVTVGQTIIHEDVMERWKKEMDEWSKKEFGRGYVEEWLHRGGSAAFARGRASASASSRGAGSS